MTDWDGKLTANLHSPVAALQVATDLGPVLWDASQTDFKCCPESGREALSRVNTWGSILANSALIAGEGKPAMVSVLPAAAMTGKTCKLWVILGSEGSKRVTNAGLLLNRRTFLSSLRRNDGVGRATPCSFVYTCKCNGAESTI